MVLKRGDRTQVEAEMKKTATDLGRLFHDREFVSKIKRIPDEDWEEEGGYYKNPYHGKGSSSNSSLKPSIFRVYFKGCSVKRGLALRIQQRSLQGLAWRSAIIGTLPGAF